MKNVNYHEGITLNGSQAEQVFNLLDRTGLNWSVNKKDLYGPEGEHTNSYGIFRSDSGSWLGTVGERYTPYQNSDLAELLVSASDGLCSFSRGGTIGGGEKVFLQAELDSKHIGNSEVKRWITALNSHDGSTSIGFGSQSTVVICQNTFYRAYGQVNHFRHTANAATRLEVAMRDLRKALGMDENLMRTFDRFADTRLNDEMVERVISKIFAVDAKTAGSEEVSTRKKNQVMSFSGALMREKRDQGDTLWALFNAATRYTNHIAAPREDDRKREYLMTGGGANINGMAFDECMKWIDANTLELVTV
jgi:phage/plasmid-like protein (TIGR03299 family)